MTSWIGKQRWILKLLFAFVVVAVLGLTWQTRLLKVEKENSSNRIQTEDNQLTSGLSCIAQHSIVFMKLHKTGSSSIQNMCFRYAVAHDLRIALPLIYNYFGHPKPFEKHMVNPLKDGQKYDMLAHHMRYNYENIRDFMPEGTVFFTIMREPASLFESAYAYFSMEMGYGMTLEEFVRHNKSSDLELLSNRITGGRIGRNQMSFDLGVDVNQFENEEEILSIAKQLDKQFQLIMIRERMNESLVLLKHLLCWSTDEMVVFNQNARAKATKKILTPELTAKILYWNNADKILYDYFLERFDEKVRIFGEDRMKEEVLELTTRIEQWYSFCVAGVLQGASAVAGHIEGFKPTNVHNETCQYLVKPELAFTDLLVRKRGRVSPT